MKLVPNSIMLARNEAEDIIGAVKEGLHFADNVHVIIDPDSTDDTEKIIKRTFRTKRVHVQHQIKDIARIKELDPDSTKEIDAMHDEGFQGHLHEGEGKLFMHWNIMYWTNKIVQPGEWWHWISPDERFAPQDYAEVWYWIRYAQQFGYEAVYTCDHLFIRDEITKRAFDWCIWFTHPGTPHHFLKMPVGGWKKGLGVHTGCTLPEMRKRLKMPVSHFHFAYVKDTRVPFKGPRDHPEYQFQPRYQFYNPMGDDWRTLPDVDCHGTLIAMDSHVCLDLPRSYEPRVEEIKVAAGTISELQVELLRKRESLEKIQSDVVKAEDKKRLLNMEFERIKRVKGWREDEIAKLLEKIKELEKTI